MGGVTRSSLQEGPTRECVCDYETERECVRVQEKQRERERVRF